MSAPYTGHGAPQEDSPPRADVPRHHGVPGARPEMAPAYEVHQAQAWGPGAASGQSGPVIEVHGVSRNFGHVPALSSVSLTVKRGDVTALVGPNGCGKSTLMLTLAALLKPNTGSVRVCGADPVEDPEAVRRAVGWMPDQFGAWDSLTVREVLATMGNAYFMPTHAISERVEYLLDLVDLSTLAGQSAHVLSRGQKQRLGLARALMHSPQLLILDEPASGLDPAARRRLVSIVRNFAQDGGSVLISSHILSELEDMADSVLFMDQGRVLEHVSLADLGSRPQVWRVSSLDGAALRSALDALGVVVQHFEDANATRNAEALLHLPSQDVAARLLKDLALKDAQLVGFALAAGRLESAYLSLDAAHRQGAL